MSGLLFHILADRIGLRRRAPAHYPMLKNSEIEGRRKSRIRAHSVVYAGRCHSKASERGARSKAGRSAESLTTSKYHPSGPNDAVAIRKFLRHRRGEGLRRLRGESMRGE